MSTIEDRENQKKNFLLEFFQKDSFEINNLPVDCSFRTYARVVSNDKTYILMDCPPGKEEIEPFINVTKFLLHINLSVPRIYKQDIKKGFAIIEDFGDELFNKIISKNNDPQFEERLYKYSVDLLSYLHKQKFDGYGFKEYDDEMLFKEVNLFVDWYYPILFGEEISLALRRKFIKVWESLFDKLNFKNNCFVLRDYHVDNLMWLADRQSIQRVGLLDYQDAVIGSYAYDLVSLLEDARRNVSGELRSKMINYYMSLSPNLDRKKFLADYAILGVQRNCKIIGVFSRKSTRDHNKKYLNFLPRVWSYMNENVDHPLLFSLREWFLESRIPAIKVSQYD